MINWSGAFPRALDAPPLGADNRLPSAPTLSSPNEAAEVAHASFDPTWTAARRALDYQLQTATNNIFTTGVVNTTVAALHKLDPGLSAGTYYWRVRARNAKGVSAWSAGRSVVLT